ncbi:MAG: twin transmembrane helix small protein [Rhodobacteraceae bacterium]|uniref:twin transmembrane helix small protein n=1 Tax=Amaricoccus sp. B4 TaxID=3368557 RepID=UPI000DAD7737|nr:twin transmembrane helix small protein [Paracoccaceae bacterium]
MLHDPLFVLAAIACLAVLAVLVFGIGTFGKGGDFNRKYANKIMRLRLLMQFIAIILIVVFVYFSRKGG